MGEALHHHDDCGWQAQLSLGFERRGGRSALTLARHFGPLRVQRPFHPEGGEVPHLYLLHPPGGIAPGDELEIDLDLGAGSRALLTTPAATKVYGVGARRLAQRQTLTARVAAGAVLEWLPQETIVFDGARVTLDSRFELTGDAGLIAWELVTLGRRAGEAPFRSGSCLQRLEVWRDGVPLLLERLPLTGDSPLLSAPWGLGGAGTFGTLLAVGRLDGAALTALRELGAAVGDRCWAVTALPELVVLRYRGDDPRRALAAFSAAWTILRPLLHGRPAVVPRIWAT